MDMTNYFDLEQSWVWELVGDVWLFFGIGMFLIWFLSLKAKAPFQVPSLLSIIWCGVCFSIAYQQLLIIWFMAILITGFMFYYGISKLLR